MENQETNNTPEALARRIKDLEAENAALRRQVAKFESRIHPDSSVDDTLIQSLIDSSPDIAAVIDIDLTIKFLNLNARKTLGNDSGRLIGQNIQVMFPVAKRKKCLSLFKSFAAAPQPVTYDQTFDLCLSTGDRTEIPVEAMLCPWQNSQDTIVFVLFRDISDLRSHEAQMQMMTEEALTANEAKSDFLAAASHDIRQPLQTLRLIQGVLSKRVKGEDAVGLVNDLEITIASMSETLDTLLDIDQLDRGSIVPVITEFPIRTSLKRCSREFSRHARVKALSLRIVNSSAIVRTDQRLLTRILQNIVSNALKYTESGKVLIGARRRGEKLLLEIWDTGVGIPEDELDHIFERYFVGEAARNHWSQGIGLGLSVVRRLCDLLEIGLSVTSHPGSGTVFRLSLHHVADRSDEAPHQNRKVDLTPRKILVAGADALETSILSQLLELEGYKVSVAANAGDALATARKVNWPDIAIVDVVLPQRVRGIDLARQLQNESNEYVESIILTSQARATDFAEIQAAGLSFLRKPAAPDELLGLIDQRLKRDLNQPKPEILSKGTIYIVERDSGQRRYLHDTLIASGYPSRSYGTAEDFLEDADYHDMTCVIVGVVLPGISGLELLLKLTDDAPGVPVILLVGSNNLGAVAEALKNGAFDVIEKPIQSDALRDVISRALQISSRTRESQSQRREHESNFAKLTHREAEVIRHVASGAANKEIGYRLNISERTVEGHRSRAMAKLGVQTVADVVRITDALGIDPLTN